MKRIPPRGAWPKGADCASVSYSHTISRGRALTQGGAIWPPTTRDCDERSYLINGIDLHELWQ